MTKIKHYFSLIKFSHTIFALPFALIGFFLASVNNTIDWLTLIYVVLCMVFARSAAMAFNRYTDYKIDQKNERTAVREIPKGIISPKSAFIFTALNSILFIATTWFINPLCFYLSPVALFTILIYSYTKRFTFLCHFVLGLGLALAPIGAYIAVTGTFAILPLLFSFIVLTWTGGFDIIYSLQDEEFDRGEDLYSIPVKLGRKGALQLSILVHLITAALIIYAGFFENFSWPYWVGSSIFIGLLVYQHIIVKPHDISKVNLAFGTTNGIASVVFASITIFSIFFK